MTTFDRVKRLWNHYYGLTPALGANGAGIHDLLDELDEEAGITTVWPDNHVCQCSEGNWVCPGNHKERRAVGARLALHEVHITYTQEQEGAEKQSVSHWGIFQV